MKKYKLKKNPKLSLKKDVYTHLDKQFIDLLLLAFVQSSIRYFSNALNYAKIGEYCKDCYDQYELCKCEGDEEQFFDPIIKKSRNQACTLCLQNYCICDYNIKSLKDLRKNIIILLVNLNNKYLLSDFYNQIMRYYSNKTEDDLRNESFKPGEYSNYITRLQKALARDH